MPRRPVTTLRGSDRGEGSLPQNRPLLLVSGATATIRRLAGHPHLGRLTQPRCGNDIAEMAASGLYWAADNDALAGIDPDRLMDMLDAMATTDLSRCLFGAVPDAVEMTDQGPRGSWEGTLWLFRAWRRAYEARGIPPAIVLQDGATVETVPWGDIAAVFVGGSTAWKLGQEAEGLIRAARARGKWVHVGRVNTERRLKHFDAIGIDSFDGTQFSMFPDTYIPRWLKRLEHRQLGMMAAD
jgi:hypothetical protein